MLKAITILGAWLAVFTVALIPTCTAVGAESMILEEFVNLQRPQIARNSKSAKRHKRRSYHVFYIVIGTLAWVVLTAATAALVGYLWRSINLNASGTSASTFELSSIAWLVSTIRLLLVIVDYYEYRKHTRFRIWLQTIRTDGVAMCHLYYYIGLGRRGLNRAILVTIAQVFVLLLVWLDDETRTRPPDDPKTNIALAIVIATMISFFIIKRLILAAWLIVRPDIELINICTAVHVRSQKGELHRAAKQARGVRPGRWRNDLHLTSFRAAKLVENCLPSMRKRFSQSDMEQIFLAARKIAESLRLHSLHVTDSKEARDQFELRKLLAMRIVTAADPLSIADAIMDLTHPEPDAPQLPKRRSARITEATNDAISRYWPSLRVVFVVLAIIALLIFGRYTDVTGLLGK